MLDAVQGQPAVAVILTVPAPPAAWNDCEAGEMSYEQACDCVTVNGRPAATMVPVRAGPDVGATLKPTTPAPLPVVPFVTVIQSALLAAVHAQPGAAVTVICPEPPLPPAEYDVGMIP